MNFELPIGGTLIFSYVSLEPAYTLRPQKYKKYQATPPPQKIFEILATRILYLDLKKKSRMHSNDP